MFPIPWNFPFRKKDGSLSTISAEMGGVLPPATTNKLGGVKVGSGLSVTSDGTLSGKNELPAYTIATAGKVLTVGDDGSLEWDEKGTGGGDSFTALLLPVIEPRTDDVRISVSQLPLNTNPNSYPTYKFTGSYTLDEVFIPENYDYMEFYGDLRSSDVTALNLTLLAEVLSNPATEVVLNESISDFDAILIQGCYDSSGVSNYDTTIVYSNPQISTPYWFGMKDRNATYSGTITFSDVTHGTISASRRLKIYGFNW